MSFAITEVTSDSGQRFSVALDDRTNDPIVDCMRSGVLPEPEFNPFARFVLQRSADQGLLIDLGCHLGMFSLPFAAVGVPVLAIDANKNNTDLLQHTAQFNGWNHLQVILGAVSDHAGRVALVNDGPYGIVVDDASGDIQCATLDELVGMRSVSLIKIDIEGSEPRAIKGASQTLSRNRDVVVICESNRPLLEQSGSSPQDLWQLFHSLGFQCYEFFGAKLMPRSVGSFQERTVADFVALRSASFELPPGYSIGEPTVEESVEMLLTDLKYGHVTHVMRALKAAPRAVLAHPQIAAILRNS